MRISSLFVLVCCLFALSASAQDTLYFKNAGKTVVSVKEVSQKEIQYKKFEMPDGPMYIVNKSDIEKIVYKNGYTEILNAPVAGNSDSEKPFEVMSEAVAVNNEKITVADTKKRYYSVVNLINTHPDPNRKKPLMDLWVDMKNVNRHKKGTTAMSIAFGGVAVGGGLVYALVASQGFGDEPLFAAPPLLFGTLAVAFCTASVSLHIKLNKQRKAFVKLYNE